MSGGRAQGRGAIGHGIFGAILAATVLVVFTLGAARASAYVNPFSQGDWSPGRIDMGVDMIPNHR